jgi:two-component system NtrC family sensor kinase
VRNADLLQLLEVAPDAHDSHKGEVSLEDGRTLYATLTAIPEIGQAIIMQDITHLKALDQMKSDFVSTVSHDLRTPLSSIKDYVQMLDRAGDLNERQRLFVGRITKGVDHLAALINNLLDLSSIEMEQELVPVNLSDLATQVITEYQDQATRKRQKLICHGNGQQAVVIGSEVRLKQVLNNLIDNAVKYTPEAGQISTLVQIDHKQVLFKVEDDGPGISPSDLPFVFDKFFRGTHENVAETTGAGLGLSICKSVIEKYQGHIWAESQPGQGSRFTFSLPLASSPLTASPLTNSSLKEELRSN